MEDRGVLERQKYYKVVICGYILLISGFVGIMHIPAIWRVAIAAVAAVWIAFIMYNGRGNIVGSHTEYDTDGVANEHDEHDD